MNALTIKQTNQSVVITLDKSVFDVNYISNLLTQIRTEYLVQQADFDDSIEEIAEEIKANWWAKNRQSILNKIENIH
jgi:predicted DNA-binding protein YlxM (UPF0122 family)